MKVKQISIGLFGTAGECKTVVLDLVEGKIVAGDSETLDIALSAITGRAREAGSVGEKVADKIEEAVETGTAAIDEAAAAAAAAAKADEEDRRIAKETADALTATGFDIDDDEELSGADAADAELDALIGEG